MIKWAYMRKGWTSCNKALEFLEQNKIEIKEVIDARKEKIVEDGALDIINAAARIYIARGKKFSTYEPDGGFKEEILKNSLGRSGTLRAPTFIIGDSVIVGFNEELYKEQLT